MSSHLTYSERARYCISTTGQRLLLLLDNKKTNLALSADVTKADELLVLADTLGPEICIFKTHIDIIQDFTPALTSELHKLARKHQFLLFEDRKFADIGNTVKHQYEDGIYRIAEWADIINAHSLPGPSVVKGLAESGRKYNRGLLLINELSSAKNLIDEKYQQQTLAMAEPYADFVIGFITQHAVSSDPHWINMTPGIKFHEKGDTLDQQYISPEQAILEKNTDIIIVGRGIYGADQPLSAAKEYREAGWSAYKQRTSHKKLASTV